MATHLDREHIHSHIVFNSVSFKDGKKYHSNGNTVQKLMDLSDEICMRYGVVVEPEEDEDIERHSDSKVLAEEIRRKEALGMHMG